MVIRSVDLESNFSKYKMVFSSQTGSPFVFITIFQLTSDIDKVILSATVAWNDFRTLKIYGNCLAKDVTMILQALEREVEELLNDGYGFDNAVLN